MSNNIQDVRIVSNGDPSINIQDARFVDADGSPAYIESGPNVETLNGPRTILADDAKWHLFDAGGADRTITLDAGLEYQGKKITIAVYSPTGLVNTLSIVNSAAAAVTSITGSEKTELVYDGTAWRRIGDSDPEAGIPAVNVETLAGNKTITSTDARVQLLDSGGASRNVTLDASLHVVGTVVEIRAVNTGNALVVKNSAGTTLATLDYWKVYRAVYANSTWNTIRYDHVASLGDDRSTLYVGYRSGVVNTILSWGGGHRAYVDATGFGIGGFPSSLFHVTASGDANALRVDNTTGRVSMGTGSPLWDFTMAKSGGPGIAMVNGSNEGFIFGPVHAASNTYFTNNVAFGFIWQPNAVAKMWLTSAGNFGIGASPSSLFHVTASGNANALRVDNTTGSVCVNGAVFSWPFVVNSTSNAEIVAHHSSGSAVTLSMISSTAAWVRTNGTHPLLLGVNLTEYLRIANNGLISCTGTTGAFTPHVLTTTQRDALTATKGMVIYNSTTDKLQTYNGAWVDLH